MPRIMKKRNTKTECLVKDAIIYTGRKKGATYKDIKAYVNNNSSEPFISDTKIKQGIRSSLNNKSITKCGSHYKMLISPPKLRHKSSVKMMSLGKSTRTHVSAMRSWQNMALTVIFLIIMFSMFTAARADSDDDDDILGEIVIDIMTGIFLEMCSESATCSSLLMISMMALLLTVVILSCITGECLFKLPTSRDVRRGATVYAGMRTTRWFRG